MPAIKVDFGKLSQLESQLSCVPGVISSAASSVSSVRSSLDWDVACEASIDRRLRDIANALNDSKSRMQKTARFVGDALQQYQKAEENNSEYYTNSGRGGQSGGTGSSRSFTSPDDLFTLSSINNKDTKKIAKNLLGSFGPLGKALSVIAEPVANWLQYGELTNPEDSTALKLLNGAKTIVKGKGIISSFSTLINKTEKISRFHNNHNSYLFGSQHNEYFIKNLFGLNKMGKTGFRKALGDNALLSKGLKWVPGNLVEGFKTNIKNTFVNSSGKLNKWGIAGVAIDTVINGIDNYDDVKAGKITGDRAVVETVSETAFNIALTAGASTLVSAGLVAAGAFSAPAIAVAAGAGLLVTGVNMLVEKVTGDSLTHHVGTLAGNIYDSGKNAIKSIGEFFSKKTKAKVSYTNLKPAWT